MLDLAALSGFIIVGGQELDLVEVCLEHFQFLKPNEINCGDLFSGFSQKGQSGIVSNFPNMLANRLPPVTRMETAGLRREPALNLEHTATQLEVCLTAMIQKRQRCDIFTKTIG